MSQMKKTMSLQMSERKKELNSILIELLYGLGLSKTRLMLTMAIIKAHHIQYELLEWFVAYYEREDTMTVQAFMSKLNELTDESDNTDKDYDQY